MKQKKIGQRKKRRDVEKVKISQTKIDAVQ
jgi:hypothetical protein